MAKIRAFDLLNRMLENDEVTTDDVELLRAEEEGQHLEFKSGLIADQATKYRKLRWVIRKWTAGFANADGGILVIGVDDKLGPDKRHVIDGLIVSTPKPLDEWTHDTLRPLSMALQPPPRVKVVDCGGKRVLLVATSPAPTWVADAAGRYYVRIGRATARAPDALVADVIHGRRQRPRLELQAFPEQFKNRSADGVEWHLQLRLAVHNASLVETEDVAVGLVGWSLSEPGHKAQAAPPALLAHIESVRPEPHRSDKWHLVHWMIDKGAKHAPSLALDAFARSDWFHVGNAKLPARASRVRLAAYVMPRACPPQWFQIDVACSGSVSYGDEFWIREPVIERALSFAPQASFSRS